MNYLLFFFSKSNPSAHFAIMSFYYHYKCHYHHYHVIIIIKFTEVCYCMWSIFDTKNIVKRLFIFLFYDIVVFKLTFFSFLSGSSVSSGRTNNYNTCTVDSTKINRSIVISMNLYIGPKCVNTQICNAKL